MLQLTFIGFNGFGGNLVPLLPECQIGFDVLPISVVYHDLFRTLSINLATIHPQLEQLAFLRAVRQGEHQRDLAIIQMVLGAGLRISEAAALNVSDIELNDRSGWVYVRVGKGMKPRTIPLSLQVRKALQACLKARAGGDAEDLFIGQCGPLSEWGIHGIVKKYTYQARQKDVTAHTLRHSFAKNLVDADTPFDQVAILLGYESLDTIKVYAHPDDRDLKRALRNTVGEFVNEALLSFELRGWFLLR